MCIFTPRFWCFSTTKFQTQHTGKFVAFTRVSKDLETLIFLPLFITYQVFDMGNLLYIIAVILIIFWALGFFMFGYTGLIHLLLVIAVIAILLRIIGGNNPNNL